MLHAAIIGCGRIVEEGHMRAFRALADRVRVIALADPSPERLALIGESLGVPAGARYTDYRQLLAQETPDFVDLALPHFLHEEVTLACAEAGRHILSEKPLTTSLESADRILEAIRRAGGTLGIIHNYVYSEAVRWALRTIQAGQIGTPFLARSEGLGGSHFPGTPAYDPDWRTRAARAGGGCLIDNAYHSLYSCEALMNSPVVEVYARVGTFVKKQDVDDTAIVLLAHANGGTSCVQVSWAIQGGGQWVSEVHGTAGSIRFHHNRIPVEWYDNERGEWIAPQIPDQSWYDSFTNLFAEFLDALERRKQLTMNAARARHNLAIVMAAYESSKRGRPVQLAEFGE